MRKVVAAELVSVDGVFEAPEEWAFAYANEEMNEANAAGMAASDAMLLGRATYEGLAAFWPNQPGGTPMVDYINGVRKYVVSKTLEEPLGWDVAVGAASIAQQCMKAGLLDEIHVDLVPVLLGGGVRLFEHPGATLIELESTRVVEGSGVTHLTFRVLK